MTSRGRTWRLKLVPLLVAPLLACEQTMEAPEAFDSFANRVMIDGPNPILRDPALQQVEAELRSYVLMRTEPMRQAMLYQNYLGQGVGDDTAVTAAMARLVDQPPAALAAREIGPVEGPARPCALLLDPDALATLAFDGSRVPAPDWRHDGGGCADGLAQGVARFVDAAGGRSLTGRFRDGVPERFLFVDAGRAITQLSPVRIDAVEGDLVRLAKPGAPDYLHFGPIRGGLPEGMGVTAFDHRPGGPVRMERFGGFKAGLLDGRGAILKTMNVAERGSLMGIELGQFRAGKLHGPAGWTNGGDRIFAAHYQDGTANGLGANYWANLFDSQQRHWRVGPYRNGKLDGRVDFAWHTGDREAEVWQMGELVQEEGGDDFNFGQVFALASGLAVLGAADLPADMAMELGAAYVAEVMTDGQAGSTMATANRLASGMQAQGGAGAGAVRAAAPAQAAMRTESYSFSCPSGESYTIDVPYLDAAKLAVKKSFTRAMSCNLIGAMQPAMAACARAYGRSDCGEGLEPVAEDPFRPGAT